jgi:hypothetical protein
MNRVPSRSLPRTRGIALALTLFVGAVTTAVAYWGMWDAVVAYWSMRNTGGFEEPTTPPARVEDASSPVRSIVLPHDEPEFVPGPHWETFHVSCTTCHSSRLIATHPPLSSHQWAEIVHKMIAVYGAPIPPQREAEIVEYLASLSHE